MDIALGIILLVAAVFLVVAVLMQSGKDHNLSGTIAGGADTFFGKSKGKTIDKILSKVTTVVAILFVLLVIVVYIIQPEQTTDVDAETTTEAAAADVVTDAETSADTAVAVDSNVVDLDDTGAAH